MKNTIPSGIFRENLYFMKHLLLFAFLFFAVKFSNGQLTHHFPHDNAQWGQFEGAYYNDPFGPDYYMGGSHFYAAGGDSILGAKTYIKIYAADMDGNIFNYAPRLIREELSKVYYFDPDLQQDTLLYDFSLQPGDTAQFYSDFPTYPLVVDSVGQIQTGTQVRKCIYLSDPSGNALFNQLNYSLDDHTPVTWIEGIGSNDGLFVPAGGIQIVDGIAFLTCFRENDTLKYGTECNVIYDGMEDLSAENCLTLFPNPTSGEVTVLNNNLMKGEIELILYSSTGKKLWNQHLPGTSALSEHLDLSAFPAGLYLLKITAGKIDYTEKIQLIKN